MPSSYPYFLSFDEPACSISTGLLTKGVISDNVIRNQYQILNLESCFMSKRNPKTPNQGTTIADVAKAAGVSVPTVSRILNNKEYVADETRDRVNEAIKQLGYVPNIHAQ